MSEVMLKEDPLSRIQREIYEVTEREREFKEGHFHMNNNHSTSTMQINTQNGDMNGNTVPLQKKSWASSTSLLTSVPLSPTLASSSNNKGNEYKRVFHPNKNSKGIMQRFFASKGKIASENNGVPTSPLIHSKPMDFPTAPIFPTVISDISRSPKSKPIRKGFVSVEEKIHRELQEMRAREKELKRMRKKQKPFEIELSDNESSSDSEDEETQIDGTVKKAKSMGELFEALNEELRSISPRIESREGSIGSLKPAKSLASLCDLEPGQEHLAPSSSQLIAQWESIIQQKRNNGAA